MCQESIREFYVFMYHGPVYCLLSEKTMTQHVLFQGGVAKLAERP